MHYELRPRHKKKHHHFHTGQSSCASWCVLSSWELCGLSFYCDIITTKPSYITCDDVYLISKFDKLFLHFNAILFLNFTWQARHTFSAIGMTKFSGRIWHMAYDLQTSSAVSRMVKQLERITLRTVCFLHFWHWWPWRFTVLNRTSVRITFVPFTGSCSNGFVPKR
jgi:hypothetical protein